MQECAYEDIFSFREQAWIYSDFIRKASTLSKVFVITNTWWNKCVVEESLQFDAICLSNSLPCTQNCIWSGKELKYTVGAICMNIADRELKKVFAMHEEKSGVKELSSKLRLALQNRLVWILENT